MKLFVVIDMGYIILEVLPRLPGACESGQGQAREQFAGYQRGVRNVQAEVLSAGKTLWTTLCRAGGII